MKLIRCDSMKTIDDKVLQEGAIEDYLHYKDYMRNYNCSINHTINTISLGICNYIEQKFKLDKDMIENYKAKDDNQIELELS